MKRNYLINTKCRKCGSLKQDLLLRGAKNECLVCKQRMVPLVQEPVSTVETPVREEEEQKAPKTPKTPGEEAEEKTISTRVLIASRGRPIWDPKMPKTRLLEILVEIGYSEDTGSLSKRDIIKILESA